MDNQHRKIRGYRELDEVEIDLMNDIKELGTNLDRMIARLNQIEQPAIDRGDSDAKEAARWRAIARTLLQLGLMCLTRSVAKPKFF